MAGLNISFAEIIPNNIAFDVHRRDREGDPHGGVLISTKCELQMEEVTISKDFELMSGSISLLKSKKLTIATYYWPPSAMSEFYLDQVSVKVLGLHSSLKKVILILGEDFNLSDINWNTLRIEGHQYPVRVNQTFLDLIAECGLEQQVDFQTRKDNIFDLIFMTHPSYKQRCKPLPAIGNSDHEVVLYDTSLQADVRGLKDDVATYSKAVEDKEFVSVEKTWNNIKEVLQTIITKRVPSKMTELC